MKVHAPQHTAHPELLGENSTPLEVSMWSGVHHRRSFRVKTRFLPPTKVYRSKISQLCQMTWLKQRAVLFNSGPHKVRGRFEPAGMSPNAAERQINISLRVDFDSRCEILSPSCFKLSYVGHGNVGLQVVYLPPPPQPRLTRAVYYEAPVPAPRE